MPRREFNSHAIHHHHRINHEQGTTEIVRISPESANCCWRWISVLKANSTTVLLLEWCLKWGLSLRGDPRQMPSRTILPVQQR